MGAVDEMGVVGGVDGLDLVELRSEEKMFNGTAGEGDFSFVSLVLFERLLTSGFSSKNRFFVGGSSDSVSEFFSGESNTTIAVVGPALSGLFDELAFILAPSSSGGSRMTQLSSRSSCASEVSDISIASQFDVDAELDASGSVFFSVISAPCEGVSVAEKVRTLKEPDTEDEESGLLVTSSAIADFLRILSISKRNKKTIVV